MSSAARHRIGTRRLARPAWERQMKRLRMATRLLGAVLVALIARLIGTGATTPFGVSIVLIAVLFVAAVWLTHVGHGIEP